MTSITFTDLRTEGPQLLEALTAGNSIDLIHRSRIVGKVIPIDPPPKVFDADRFDKIIKSLKLKPMTVRQARINYNQHITKKYGQGIS